jgi:hypothetical protein
VKIIVTVELLEPNGRSVERWVTDITPFWNRKEGVGAGQECFEALKDSIKEVASDHER